MLLLRLPITLFHVKEVFKRVYTLSTTGQYWELCKDGELEVKRVSAVKQCCWGLACDHQIYVYVHSSDVPIRFKEETYENQRWNPVVGFCNSLLPSDRWPWSDVSGLKHQQLESFVLPSPHWEWESDWYVDENFGGEATEKGVATYTKDKRWNSCVRRRRWIRYRRYKARDTWAKIWYRNEVTHHNPEGSSWTLIPAPGEAIQISCGPYDLLWATCWEGQAIVREGIDRNNPQGTSWTIVDPPVAENGISHVSVGVNVVWAVTKDRKVWFRRGVNSYNPCGTSWIEMIGEMQMVDVGLNDQVWGINCEDRAIYFRQGVTPSELSGKMWKAIACNRESDRSQTGSSTSLLRIERRMLDREFSFFIALTSCAHSLALSISPSHTAQWRKQIFRQLSERTHRELDNFRHYEQAVEQWWRSWKPYRWVDVQVALEQFTANDGTRDSILFVYYTHNEEKKYIHMFLNEVTILVEILNEAKHSFALYTPERTKQRWPVRLATTTEQEMHDWGRQLQGPPSPEAIWSLTCKGDIFVSEPSPDLEALTHPMPCDQIDGIVWGVGYDHTAWIYTGGYGGSFLSGLAGSPENIHPQTDVKGIYIYENQRWNPVTGYSNRGLPTDRYMWSDASGLRECLTGPSISVFRAGPTEKVGSTQQTFPRPPIALRDVSIMSQPPGSTEDFVPLWAISDKGDVLCRLQGTSWLHVGTDQPFVSVTIGMFHQVWAVAQDGSAFCRGECWYHVPSPLKQKLKQVSVGRTAVLAVDKN
ncbi:Tectonin beta-propeller repeat-containing protein 1, partial [Ophiophagus hannah]